MAFKMKAGKEGPMRKNFPSAFKNLGAFITDVDDMGEETTKRATYSDTRKAEKSGKKVTYTNEEELRRTKQDIDQAKKGVKDDGTKAMNVNSLNDKDSRELMAKTLTKSLNRRKAYIKENKMDKASKKSRQLDKAAQAEIERAAVVADKKKKGINTNTKALTKAQRDALKDNKTSTRKNKQNLNTPDKESSISSTRQNKEGSVDYFSNK